MLGLEPRRILAKHGSEIEVAELLLSLGHSKYKEIRRIGPVFFVILLNYGSIRFSPFLC